MKKTVIKIGTAICAVAILIAIGYSGGYCVFSWLESWKRDHTTIIYCQDERPLIYDRSGVLLIGNYKRTQLNERVRYAAINGKFAAGLLGFTEFCDGREVGKSGIEKLIDKKEPPGNPVYLSLDCGIP